MTYKSTSIFEKASFVKDAVLSGNDGIITTFAVIAGSQGAQFDSRVVITLGIANLMADAISMASGIYLGTKSEQQMLGSSMTDHDKFSALKQSIVTFFSFIIAGVVPLLPYFFGLNIEKSFSNSLILVAISLAVLGALRGLVTRKNPIGTIIETLIVGGTAALVAYTAGSVADKFIPQQ